MTKAKRIIALFMSVVMLLGAFTMIASAAYTSYNPTLTSGDLKIIIKADKTEVKPGDTVTFDMYVDTTLTDLGTAQFVVSYNSAQAAPGATTIGDFRTFNDVFEYWFDSASSGNMNMAGTAALANARDYSNAIISASAEDKAYFDKAVMIGTKANTANGVTNTVGNGWTPTADTSVLTFTMKISDSVVPGEKIFIGYHSHTWTGKAPKAYIAQAGGAKVQYTNVDLSEAMEELTVVADTAPTVELKFSDWKNQIRFDKTADGKYANTFDGRMLVSIDNLAAVIGGEVNLANIQAKIKEIGFLYAKNGAINADTALAQIKGGAATYSVATGGGYISTGFDGKDYVVAGIIHNIPDADKTTAVSGAVYAIYDSNGDGVDEYTVLVLNGGEKFTFGDLYSRNFNTAFPA